MHERVGAFEHAHPTTRARPRRTPAIHGAAGFIRPSPGFQALSEGSGPALFSMVLLAAIIVESVLATPGDGAYGAYRCATSGGGWGPGPTGNVGTAHTSRLFASGTFSRRAPTPAAPRPPAQYATHRSKPDGSARASRRSMFPSTCRLR